MEVKTLSLNTNIMDIVKNGQLFKNITVKVSQKYLRIMLHRLSTQDDSIKSIIGYARTVAMTYNTTNFTQTLRYTNNLSTLL